MDELQYNRLDGHSPCRFWKESQQGREIQWGKSNAFASKIAADVNRPKTSCIACERIKTDRGSLSAQSALKQSNWEMPTTNTVVHGKAENGTDLTHPGDHGDTVSSTVILEVTLRAIFNADVV